MTFADVTWEDRDSDVLLARVAGEIDMANADGIRASLERRVDNHAAAAVLDLSAVTYIDSTGIHLLFALAQRMAGRGQELRIVVAEDSAVEDTLRFAGALDFIRAARTVAEAEAALTRAP